MLIAARRQLARNEFPASHGLARFLQQEQPAPGAGVATVILRELVAEHGRHALHKENGHVRQQRVGQYKPAPLPVRIPPQGLPGSRVVRNALFKSLPIGGFTGVPCSHQRCVQVGSGILQRLEQSGALPQHAPGGGAILNRFPFGSDTVLHPPVPLDEERFHVFPKGGQRGGGKLLLAGTARHERNHMLLVVLDDAQSVKPNQ